jgi:WhiB family transcriptional regulator, redox-sensing transcriptional regulator
MNEAGWMDRAACRGAPLQVFISTGDDPDEPWAPSTAALGYCLPCPVRGDCLAWALTFGEVGTWGGTSTHQRRQLRRPRSRLACPACGSRQVVDERGRARAWQGAARGQRRAAALEVCLACAVSWRASA